MLARGTSEVSGDGWGKQLMASTANKALRASVTQIDIMQTISVVANSNGGDKGGWCRGLFIENSKGILERGNSTQGRGCYWWTWVIQHIDWMFACINIRTWNRSGAVRRRHIVAACGLVRCPGIFNFLCAVVEDPRLNFESHERAFACAITRSAGAECAGVVFFIFFIKLLNSNGPGGRLINPPWAGAVIAGVCVSKGLCVCVVVIFIVVRVEVRWGGAVANVTEESWGRGPRSTRSRRKRSQGWGAGSKQK